MICLLAKNAWNFYNKVLWYAEPDDVIFVKIQWLLGGVSPYFLKWGKFFQARNFWWVRLILMKLIYLKSALKCHSFDVTIGIKILFFRVLVTIEPGRSLLQFVTTNCMKMRNFVFFFCQKAYNGCVCLFFFFFFFQGWSYRPSGPRTLRKGSF